MARFFDPKKGEFGAFFPLLDTLGITGGLKTGSKIVLRLIAVGLCDDFMVINGDKPFLLTGKKKPRKV